MSCVVRGEPAGTLINKYVLINPGKALIDYSRY
jgi:hypothetical protein